MRRVDFAESGAGPAILYVPGSFSTPAAWRPVQARLPGYRHVATSLCGYGGTDDPRDADRPGLEEQVEVLEICARRIAAPYHLVGHSFGGTIALAAVATGVLRPRSLTTFEANPFPILEAGPDSALVADTMAMAAAFEAAQLAGEADAPARILDFWGGVGSYAAMPGAARAYCRATAGINMLDWRSVRHVGPLMRGLPELDLPVLLARGSGANSVMRATTAALAERIRGARTAVIDGASHFPITTHPAACAELLAGVVAAA